MGLIRPMGPISPIRPVGPIGRIGQIGLLSAAGYSRPGKSPKLIDNQDPFAV